MARRARFLIAAFLLLARCDRRRRGGDERGAARPTRTELLVVRDDGVWRVPLESGSARRVPGTRGAVAAPGRRAGASSPSSATGSCTRVNTDGTGCGRWCEGQRPGLVAGRPAARFVRDGRIVVARRNGSAPRRSRPARGDRARRGRRTAAESRSSATAWSRSSGRRAAPSPRCSRSRPGLVARRPEDRVRRRRPASRRRRPTGPTFASSRSSAGATSPTFVARHVRTGRGPARQHHRVRVRTGQLARSASARASTSRRVPARAELLPDLDQRAPTQVAVASIGGRYKLGFASAVDNVGRGPDLDPRHAIRPDDGRAAARAHRRRADRVARRRRRAALHVVVDALALAPDPLRALRAPARRDFALVGRDRKSGFCLADHYGTAPRSATCQAGLPRELRAGRARRPNGRAGVVGRLHRPLPGELPRPERRPHGRPGRHLRARPPREPRPLAARAELRQQRRLGAAPADPPGGVPHVQVLRSCEGSERC